MKISELIKQLRARQKIHGDVIVHARDRDGSQMPINGTDVIYGIRGNTPFEKLCLLTDQSHGESNPG